MLAALARRWRASTWSWAPASEREASEAIVRNFWLHWFPAKVSLRSASWSYSLWLGTATACLFLILLVTGMLLMFFYVPAVSGAYWSVKDLAFAISFGWLLRNQHRVAAHLMVATTFLHMGRVFLTGAYRGPRSANWLIGVALLLATLLLSFTGYLLPWDQLAFWAVTVGTNIAREAPGVGEAVRFFLIGGNQIGQPTLLRFYVLHVFVLPLTVVVLVAIHLWRVRKDGGLATLEVLRRERIARPREASTTRSYSLFGLTPGTSVQVRSSTELEEADTTFSAPDLARRVALVFLVVFNLTLVLSLLSNAPLEEAANPAVTPNPAKAPWYFLWLQELVAATTIRVGRIAVSGGLIGGILVPGILLVLLAAWPFLDSSPASTEGIWFAPERRRQNLIFLVISLMIVALIVLGVSMRGPSWHFYWPWQTWPQAPSRF
ncbi:MAG TPA: cytochrome b N-terminal domain-containing protein [Candidatus Bathyarchaeia archaeon]|nr:cytochrome b N-terminal domain-containing protein [Candidatus Bathyarchaeia archaeon]